MARVRTFHDAGDDLLAIEILNKLVQAEPRNQDGRAMLADAFEQVGYQAGGLSAGEPGLRNSVLSGAYGLHTGMPQCDSVKASGPDGVRAMSTDLWLNFPDIRMDSTKAEGLQFTINLILPDIDDKVIVELDNATLTRIECLQSDTPDLTFAVNRADLVTVMMGAATFEQPIGAGKATTKDDVAILGRLAGLMVAFDRSLR